MREDGPGRGDARQLGSDADDQDLRELFAPLRAQTTATAGELARVRAAAGPAPRARRRWIVSGTSVGAAAGLAAAVVLLVDRGHPGTFVGEAGARELLLAAADATRDDLPARGWRLSRSTDVTRLELEGRRCASCATERALLELTSVQEVWTGPRGEAYARSRSGDPRALRGAPLLAAVGALEGATPAQRRRTARGQHVLPAARRARDTGAPVGLRLPGAIADPAAVPDDPAGLVAWVRTRIERQRHVPGAPQDPRFFEVSDGEVNAALVDVAVSPQLGGRQRAAALEALAGRPGVSAVAAPAPFAAPGRAGIRIESEGPGGRSTRAGPPAEPGAAAPHRLVIVDRRTHRVVAEAFRQGDRVAGSMAFRVHGRSLRMVAGSGNETRYAPPVAVPGPGRTPDGKLRMDLRAAYDLERDGSSARWRERQRREDAARARRG